MRHSTLYTLVFTAIVCLICAIIVTGSTVILKARQEVNALLDKQKNVLKVAGLMEAGESLTGDQVRERFSQNIKERLVDLSTGDCIADPAEEAKQLEGYDEEKVVADPTRSKEAPANDARVMRLPNYARVYMVMKDNQLERIVLPVTGKGLWSTLYGMMSLDKDIKTVRGITFYKQGETPGLGGEITNPKWTALWDGRTAYDDEGKTVIRIVKGPATSKSEVDGLSAATLTCRGVTNLLHFWLGENGYGPFLAKIRKTGSGV